jgi:DNA repair protein RecN (Recombination protein N)
MLAELSIDDLVLIAGARLELAPGLNVITGETGAGKSLLAQAVGLLLGQKGGDELVRPGAQRALVQALFENGETLAVARELPRGGRSRSHLNGLYSSAAAVEEALRPRLAFYGQLEHTRLLQLERQLDLLDAAADDVAPLLAAYVAAYEQARALSRELGELRGAGREREREIEMLRYQTAEIDAAEVQPGEDERLGAERERLRHAGKLLERAGGALGLLAGESEAAALDAVRVAQRLVGEAAALDAALDAAAARLDGIAAELDDVAAALRAYLDDLDVDPAHRDALELRFDRLKALMRKYGPSADGVLDYGRTAHARLARLEEFEADEEALTRRAEEAQEVALAAAARLTAARLTAAPRIAARVQDELRGLAMPHASFSILVEPRGDGWAALGPRGADEVEFSFSANPGVPPRPLRETASGGELSRAMLAIRGLVTLGDDVETLIFDEVDTGIGGVTASALGERLARLADGRQVVCITHLPQVAAFAERQFAIVKESDPAAGTTVTAVRRVEGEDRLAELCRMLGAAPDDAAARSHAEGLLRRAAAGA